jgi:replicative DNA helicase
MQAKPLPNNEIAEKTLIGFLLYGTYLHQIAAEIQPDDFYSAKHRTIYAAALDLFAAMVPVDPLTISDALQKSGNLDKIGGPSYLNECLGFAFSDELLDGSIVMVKDAAMNRHGYAATVAASNRFANPSEMAEDVLSDLQSAIVGISARNSKAKTIDQSTAVQSAYEQIEACANQGKITGVPTGYQQLDYLTGGLQPGELILLAARPSMGKTSLMMNIARNAAGIGRRVYIFTLEMSAASLANRMIFTEAKIDSRLAKTGELGKDAYRQEMHRVSRAISTINQLPIWYNETSFGITEICSYAKRESVSRGIDLICIDYIQLISSGLRNAGLNEQVGMISANLKRLAKELSVPILALSQLSRVNEIGKVKRPTLNALRDSGSLEQDADAVILLHSKDYYDREAEGVNPDQWQTDVILEKQRNGPTDTLSMVYHRNYTKFVGKRKQGAFWVEETEPEDFGH